MRSQVIVSPSGERLVVLAESDYEALLRAAAAAGMEVEAPHAGHVAQHLPPEKLAEIDEGETPVRVWREFRGLSLTELADRTRLLEEDLAEIETRQREPTVEVLKVLARALGVSMDDLVR